MHRKTVQILIVIFFLFFSINLIAQDVIEINLSITDTMIARKKVKKNYKYAVKVNAEINVPNFQDSVIFYTFNKYVPSNTFVCEFSPETYKTRSLGLLYVIEDKNSNIIAPPLPPLPDSYGKKIFNRMNERFFVSSKLKIERKLLNEKELRDYDLAKYVISNENQKLVLYPLLGECHWYGLTKGEYYLYFVYSNYNLQVPHPEMRVKGILDEGNIFRGYFVSNKVKLIVK